MIGNIKIFAPPVLLLYAGLLLVGVPIALVETDCKTMYKFNYILPAQAIACWLQEPIGGDDDREVPVAGQDRTQQGDQGER